MFSRNPVHYLGICLMAAVLALPILAIPALADAAPTGSGTIRVGLQLDCSSVPNTPAAQSVLAKYGLCGHAKSSLIRPDLTINDNCGSLSLNLFNFNGGEMEWKAEITSSLGPFTSAGYGGSWDNFNGGQGPVLRTFSGLTSDWLDIFPIHTGAGRVVGQINLAEDILWWGATCKSTTTIGVSVYVT